MIINYWEKDIEFWIYMYPYKTKEETLRNYKIRDVNVIHEESFIEIKFEKKDAIIATGITLIKYKEILEADINDTSIFLKDDKCEQGIEADEIIIIDNIKKSKSKNFSLMIKSDKHNLVPQKTTIAYYNVNDEYEETILNEILEQLPSVWENNNLAEKVKVVDEKNSNVKKN